MLCVGMSMKAGVLLGLRPEIDWGRAGSPVPRYCPSHVMARPTLLFTRSIRITFLLSESFPRRRVVGHLAGVWRTTRRHRRQRDRPVDPVR